MKTKLITFIIPVILIGFFVCPDSVSATVVRSIPISIFDSSGALKNSFDIPITNNTGGASIAVADLGTDDVPEIIIGNGMGNEPRVRILRQDGSEITSFLAYAANYGRGITVATCDLDQDGYREIITGTQYGGGPHVRIFDNVGNPKFGNGFFAYKEDFRGGVNVACDDIDNDGKVEIITAPGPTGGPHVRIWERNEPNWIIDTEFFAFDANDSNGLSLAISKNGTKYLFVSHLTGNDSKILTYKIQSDPQFVASKSNKLETGNIIATATVDNTISEKIIIAPTGTKNYNVMDTDGEQVIKSEIPLNIATADLDGDGIDEIITVPSGHLVGPNDSKNIIVDISEQRLFAYENGLLSHSFFISSGTHYFPTPLGNYEILAKKPEVDYTWSYGESNPENYSLGPTPWNLMFKPHYYIHYAFWHNNFGHRMSHGCVNVDLENMQWIYNWAELGTPVDIVE